MNRVSFIVDDSFPAEFKVPIIRENGSFFYRTKTMFISCSPLLQDDFAIMIPTQKNTYMLSKIPKILCQIPVQYKDCVRNTNHSFEAELVRIANWRNAKIIEFNAARSEPIYQPMKIQKLIDSIKKADHLSKGLRYRITRRVYSRMNMISIIKNAKKSYDSHVNSVWDRVLDQIMKDEAHERYKAKCAIKIQKAWHQSITNPVFLMCRNRLLREFDLLNEIM